MIKTKRKCDNKGCNNPHFAKGFCKWHQYLRSDYKKPEFKQTKINPVSKKRAALDRAYSILRKKFLEQPENKYCPVAKLVFGKVLETTDVHHTYSGKDRSKHYLQVDTWIAVSREGHNYIHDNPAWARANNFLK